MSDDFTATGLEMFRKAGFPVAGIHSDNGGAGNVEAVTDLTDFLLARIAEDEAVALAALHQYGPWRYNPSKHNVSPATGIAEESVFAGATGPAAITVASTGPSDDPQSMTDAEHIARWNPARVLAKCAADRLIVELQLTPGELDEESDAYIAGAGDRKTDVLRLLALPHADHPDYREEWAL